MAYPLQMAAADENAQPERRSPESAYGKPSDIGSVTPETAIHSKDEMGTRGPTDVVAESSAVGMSNDSTVEETVAVAPAEPSPVPNQSVPESPASESPVSESPVPDQPVSESTVPNQPVSESTVPEQAASERAVPEQPGVGESVRGDAGSVPTQSATTPKVVADGATKTGQSPSASSNPTPAKPLAKKPSVKVLEGVVTAVSSDEVDLTLPDGRLGVIYRRNFGLNDEEPSSVLSVGDGVIGAELAREDPKGRVVLSRSWVLKKQKWEKLEAAAEASDLVTGKVISTNKNGLVVDVGVRAFIPASHVELQPVQDLAPYVGQTLEAKIIEINPSSERLVLSRRPILLRSQRKQVKELLSSLNPGDVKSGVVVSLAAYGAFVDLGGVKGLVHVSEMAWERIGKPADLLAVGDEVEVKILDLNVKKRRIGLSIRQLTEDPLSSIQPNTIVTGRVTRLVDFGAFVDLGVIEGLVHLSELAEYRVQAPEEVVTPGDDIRVKVLSVDPKRRRVALSVRQAAEFGG